MVPKERVLEFEKRKKIYKLILEKPGLHLRGLERRTDFSFGALRYHLDYMVKRGLITSGSGKGYSRYYVSNNVGNGDKVLLSAFRQPVLRKMFVIFLLCEDKKIFFKEDFKDLPFLRNWYDPQKSVILKHRTTLEFHLKKLVEINVLEVVKVKRKTGYRFVCADEIWDFLVRYSDALPYREIEKLLYWTDKLIVPEATDPVIDFIFDVFPHPYHV